MSLSSDLISQFVKVTNDDTKTKTESTVYGTIVENNGSKYVQIDGSELLTPVSTTADARDGERVTVMIKNHTAIITGNLSSPAARVDDVQDVTELSRKISEFEIVIADKVSTETLDAEIARIDSLTADNVTIKNSLTAAEADIDNLQVNDLEVKESLTAVEADIENLQTTKLDAEIADITYATIESLEATNADIYNLQSVYGDFEVLASDKFTAIEAVIESLDVTYANIDFSNIGKAAMEYFYSESGLIKDVTVGDATISGELIGVTISGDLLKGNTVVAEKLVIKGEDGLYYKLNTDGVTVEKEQTDYNSLNGKVILAKSITASKITVDDLVAFDATIGGFNITESSIYSGVKETVDNTTRGIYLDNDGQVAFGDTSNFIKYYKDTDGTYKLEISAKSLTFSSNNKTVETMFTDMQADIDGIEIGGRNLLINTKDMTGFYANRTATEYIVGDDGYSYANFPAVDTLDHRAISSTRAMIEIEEVIGRNIVFSFEMRSDTAWTPSGSNIIVSLSLCNDSSTERLKYRSVYITETIGIEWKKYEVKATLTENYFTSGTGSFDDCTRFYVQIYNYSLNHLQIRKPKVEYGNIATDYTEAPEDIDTDIADAAKTATNFMTYDSTNGLQIGNKASSSWTGFRTQITNSAFNILNAAGTALASYGEKLIELGKNATDAIIKLCGGKGQIEYVTDEDTSDEYLQITADKLRVKSSEMSSVYSMYTDESTRWEKSAVNVSTTKVDMYASECIDPTLSEKVEGWNTSEFTVNPDSIEASTPGDITLDPDGTTNLKSNVYVSNNDKSAYNDGVAGWYFGTDGTAHATNASKGGLIGFHYAGSTDYTSLIQESESGVISINGMDFGVNQVLWSGAYYMNASQTITLKQAISEQVSGIVLVFSYYDSGAVQDYSFNTHFVSKKQIDLFPSCGHTFFMGINAGFSSIGAKYLYFTDTSITGHSGNTSSGTNSGITFDNSKYVLRYVIGV